jgi:glycosyltransferase involved in cell wall biosynthesis
VRWIHVLHDVQLFEPSGALVDATPFTAWQKFWSGLRRRALKNPDLVISPTAWLLEQHMRRGFFHGIKSEVLPNPAPPVSFAMRAASSEPKLFFLGHTKGKGGEFVDQLAKRISYPIHRIVSAPNEEVIEAMRNADIFLFPSQVVENQPTALLEAASLGLPVIASDVGGVRETLKGAGIVLPKDNIQAWIDAIEFLRDPTNYREQTSKMYELAKKHDPKEYAERFVSLIKEGQI